MATPKLGLKLIDGRGPCAQSPDGAHDGGQVYDLDFNTQRIDDLAGSANGLATLDGTGKVPAGQIPGGGGGGSYPDSVTVPAGADLTAGMLVNLSTIGGVTKAIPASSSGFLPANGFVTSNFATDAQAIVFLEGKVSFTVVDASNVFNGFPVPLGDGGKISETGFSPGVLAQNVGFVLSPDNDVNVTILFSGVSFSSNDAITQNLAYSFAKQTQDCSLVSPGANIVVSIIGQSGSDSLILTGTPAGAFNLNITTVSNFHMAHTVIAIVNQTGKDVTIFSTSGAQAVNAAGGLAAALATGKAALYLVQNLDAPIQLTAAF